jgi:hypothetical protein
MRGSGVRIPSAAPTSSLSSPCPAGRHGRQNVPKTWVTTLDRTGCRGLQGSLLQVEVSETVAHEADEQNIVVDFLDSESLASRSRATNHRHSSMTEHSFHGISTSRPMAKSVTHVSGTVCHLSLRLLILCHPGKPSTHASSVGRRWASAVSDEDRRSAAPPAHARPPIPVRVHLRPGFGSFGSGHAAIGSRCPTDPQCGSCSPCELSVFAK